MPSTEVQSYSPKVSAPKGGVTHGVQYKEFSQKFDLNPYKSFMEKHLQHYGYFCKKRDLEKNYGRDVEFSNSEGSSTSSSDDDKSEDEAAKSNQVQMMFMNGKQVQKLKEPRGLFAFMSGNQGARYPFDMQVLADTIEHDDVVPKQKETLYTHTGHERTPMVRGEERGGILVYQYIATHTDYFVRSRINGSGALRTVTFNQSKDDLVFESRFESANLEEAVKVGVHEYELTLRCDLYTEKHTQWFYFQVSNAKPGVKYTFTIVNLMKPNSLYNYGMKPCFYSEIDAKTKNVGWRRAATDIKYYKNNTQRPDCMRPFYSLTFSMVFENDPSDKCYFAHCYPYTYTMLQKYLKKLSDDPRYTKICKQRILCKTLAGNVAYVLSITNPVNPNAGNKEQPKKGVVITARVHPGESNSSWMMKGVLDYLLSNSPDANLLRQMYVFKIVPMLNPDGVIVGNYRCSLAGRDLNRNYKTVLRDAYPTVWYTRQMIRKVRDEMGVVLYVDLHGHSRKHNVFMYGCEKLTVPSQRLRSRVFPYMMSNNSSKFSYKSSKFKVQKSKEGCGRISIWNLGITNSYTMESTFCGSNVGGAVNSYHFTTYDLEVLGYELLDTLLDFSDPNPVKYAKILYQLELDLKLEIMKKWAAKGISRDISSISDKELQQVLDDISDSEIESNTSGSDSSDDNGLPVHLMELAQQALKGPAKKFKTKKELNNRRKSLFVGEGNPGNRTFKDMNKVPDLEPKTASPPDASGKSVPNKTGPKVKDTNEEKNVEPVKKESSQGKRTSFKYTKQKTQDDTVMRKEIQAGPSRAAGILDWSAICVEHQTSLADVEVFPCDGVTKHGVTKRDVSTQFTPLPQTHKHILETSSAQQRQQDKLRDQKLRPDSFVTPFGEWQSKMNENKKKFQLQQAPPPWPPTGGSTNNQTLKNLEKAYKDQSSLHWLPKQIRKNNNDLLKSWSKPTKKDRIIPATSFQPSGNAQKPRDSLSNGEVLPFQRITHTKMSEPLLTERLASNNNIYGITPEQPPSFVDKGHLPTGGKLQQGTESILDKLNKENRNNHNDSKKEEYSEPVDKGKEPEPMDVISEEPLNEAEKDSKKMNANEGKYYLKASQERATSEHRNRMAKNDVMPIIREPELNVKAAPSPVGRPERSVPTGRISVTERQSVSRQMSEEKLRKVNIDHSNKSKGETLELPKGPGSSESSRGLRKMVAFSIDDSMISATPKSKKSAKSNHILVSLKQPSVFEDQDNVTVSSPDVIDVQEEKVRQASASSEARRRKLLFTDSKSNEDKKPETRAENPTNHLKEPNINRDSVSKNSTRVVYSRREPLRFNESDYSHVMKRENTFKREDTLFLGGNGKEVSNLDIISTSSSGQVSKFEHNIPISPRPVSDQALTSNPDLRPPVFKYGGQNRRKFDPETFFKNVN